MSKFKPPTEAAPGPDDSAIRGQLQAALGPGYSVDRELGGGGMSRVFLARDMALGRSVVVKLLPPDLAAGVSVDRFRREIALAAGLQHPNIVPILSAGEAAGLPYFTMPYVRGESLRALLTRDAQLEARQVARVMRDVASALATAHAEGIVHRDIKPDNILLSNGAAMVTDFGVAKALSSSRDRLDDNDPTLTSVGTSLGTPTYMAPEQAAADPSTDHRADIYALGVTAYEMLAGRVPFERATAHATMKAHFSEPPPPLSSYRTDVPPHLDALVMRCLEKDPAARPQEAAVILEALDEFATGRTFVPPTHPPRPRRTRSVLLTMAVVLLTLVVGALWFGTPLLSRHDPVPGTVRLALVPFENQGSGEEAYFAEGLSDAIGNSLARLDGIALVDRRAVPEGASRSVTELGRQLDVAYVLTGSVRWAGAPGEQRRAQVTPSLIRVADGTTVWSPQPYIVTPTDVFAVQSQIATEVADALNLALAPGDRRALSDQPTRSPEAYDAYLRGLDFFRRARREAGFEPELLNRAIESYELATRADPQFALAYAKLAEATYWWASLAPSDAHRTAQFERALARATELDPALPEIRALRALRVEH